MKVYSTRRGFTANALLQVGLVTRDMVYARTIELALSAGRGVHEIRQSDYERAKCELTGEADFDKQQAMIDFNETR